MMLSPSGMYVRLESGAAAPDLARTTQIAAATRHPVTMRAQNCRNLVNLQLVAPTIIDRRIAFAGDNWPTGELLRPFARQQHSPAASPKVLKSLVGANSHYHILN